MKIQPLGNIIQLEIEEATAGDLITSSRESAVEYAKVVALPKLLETKTFEGYCGGFDIDENVVNKLPQWEDEPVEIELDFEGEK